jgi:maleylacetate reductase
MNTRKSWSYKNGRTDVFFTGSVREVIRGFSTLPALASKTHLVIICGKSERSQALARNVCSEITEGRFVVQLLANAVEHVPIESVEETFAALPDPALKPFFFIVIGGGSPIGLAKALSRRYANGIFTVVVPTTYSGSEMTAMAGITANNRKTVYRDERMRPDMVIYDVELVRSNSKDNALLSAFNALAHAIDALYDESASPVSILLAEEAFQTIFQRLHKISLIPDSFCDDESCEDFFYGAYLAGSVLDSNKMVLSSGENRVLLHTVRRNHTILHGTLSNLLFVFIEIGDST